jgi:hypothetical protein
MHHLREVVRKTYGKAVSPSVVLIDSRSVRTSHPVDSVERTFAWIENYRRMTTDYEYKTESAETMLQITFCQIMMKKPFK